MEFQMYSLGFCHSSVCTSLPEEEAVKRINEKHPTGIDSQWVRSENEYFEGGVYKNGCDCPTYPGNKHYLMVC